jgi:hypothetical protein
MEVEKETQRCHQEIITKVNIEITPMNHEIKTLKNERKHYVKSSKGLKILCKLKRNFFCTMGSTKMTS